MKYFHGKTYANGKAKVRARVLIPIHFGINECGKEEFIADLKSFTALYGNNKSPGGKTKNKYFLLTKLLRLIFPKMKDVTKQFEAIESSDLRAKEEKKGNHFIGGFYPIGEILDGRYPDGTEIV